MAKGNRTRPCSNCKKSKVRCEYQDSLPCVRCINNGLASTCQFVFKLPPLKFPLLNTSTDTLFNSDENGTKSVSRPSSVIYNSASQIQPQNNLSNMLPSMIPTPITFIPQPSSTPKPRPSLLHPKSVPKVPLKPEIDDFEWKLSIENKLNSVDSKFNDILNVLSGNQRSLTSSRQYEPQDPNMTGRMLQNYSNTKLEMSLSMNVAQGKRRLSVDDANSSPKRLKYGPSDFRDNVLSIEEAKMLFKFFDENIAQQLFGFEIKKFAVDVLWESSPILVCAICTIALMHFQGDEICSKQEPLQRHLRELCTNVLFSNRPRTEKEAFNTIVSLVFCSFWLADSQMFTGLALQLAKEFNLNRPANGEQSKSSLCEEDRIKLWYLLFILDGQQSMALNRQSLVSSDDYSIRNPRQLLSKEEPLKLEGDSKDSRNNEQEIGEYQNSKHQQQGKLTDLRLVSQVEYNIALSESFKGNAWDLLAPKSFGIPSRTNLELDKWMVSWTVLLAPMNNGAVWLSKSTLIYYNFAKMHINSSVIRQLQEDKGSENILLPNWRKYKTPVDQGASSHEKGKVIEIISHDEDTDDSDEDNEDDFVSNSGLVTQDQALVSYNIAISAAQTVLNLVLNDLDILNNLKYVPVHIHMMLYYAAILLVSPPALATEGESETPQYFQDVIEKLKIVRSLQKKVYLNLPTDRLFGDQFIKNLENLFEERISKLLSEAQTSSLTISQKAMLINEISMLQFTTKIEHLRPDSLDSINRELSPRPERISAWPGSHHGHP